LSDILDGVAGVVAIGLVAAGLIGSQGTPRILLALGFLLFVPGRAITANWDQLALRSQATVSMLFSLVILALLATVTLWAHYWHPIGLVQAEAGLSLVGLAVAATRRHLHRRRDTPVASNTGADSSVPTQVLLNLMRGRAEGTAAPPGLAELGETASPVNPPTAQQ